MPLLLCGYPGVHLYLAYRVAYRLRHGSPLPGKLPADTPLRFLALSPDGAKLVPPGAPSFRPVEDLRAHVSASPLHLSASPPSYLSREQLGFFGRVLFLTQHPVSAVCSLAAWQAVVRRERPAASPQECLGRLKWWELYQGEALQDAKRGAFAFLAAESMRHDPQGFGLTLARAMGLAISGAQAAEVVGLEIEEVERHPLLAPGLDPEESLTRELAAEIWRQGRAMAACLGYASARPEPPASPAPSDGEARDLFLLRMNATDPFLSFKREMFRLRTLPRSRGVTVAHIPARAGSRRLPGKNIRQLGGIPLLAWSVRAAGRLEGVDHVVIDTDSSEYAEIARSHGAECLGLRPPELAGDNASPLEAVVRTLALLRRQGLKTRRLVSLYPTSPFRDPRLMQGLLDELDRRANVNTAVKVTLRPDQLYPAEQNNVPIPLAGTLGRDLPSGTFFKTTGHFVGSNFLAEDSRSLYHFLEHPAEWIDIDTEADFRAAEAIVGKKLYPPLGES